LNYFVIHLCHEFELVTMKTLPFGGPDLGFVHSQFNFYSSNMYNNQMPKSK
jgi:hypothetical protein